MHTFSRTTAIGISSFRTTLCLTTFIHMAYIRIRIGIGRGRMNTLYFWHPLACINKFLILSFGGNDWKERARRGGSVLRKKSCAT
ncbi:hypothetical protein B0H14DRAFT_2915852 [Mycena olivaceomarginata]|nr:hypothetical protein B0H14DRAFT_2915852 [Mycena olivaceomarginata]